eukprot:gnl/MRDRNA2_/MRDRNA2_54519_c0_seq1.p2 gnl/MRDRNA2_/MRDRNA2_54519_c0~~gnl/MRDRNA2_/MRDRNA2_54519_c0_seq1.p2  ORF type:complete len:106 (-),score=4.56 gnl/MRDRNA2_/MRDRNA2_54519_c0_seq1:323-640(-)
MHWAHPKIICFNAGARELTSRMSGVRTPFVLHHMSQNSVIGSIKVLLRLPLPLQLHLHLTLLVQPPLSPLPPTRNPPPVSPLPPLPNSIQPQFPSQAHTQPQPPP